MRSTNRKPGPFSVYRQQLTLLGSMWLELRQVFNHFSTCPNTRAIILSGAGPKAFTAGLDVQHASESGPLADGSPPQDGARTATSYRRHILEFQDCITAVEMCEKPVICVLHGFTMGLGIDLSTSADVRICSNDTKFSVKEVDIGLAADIGTLSRLPKVTGNFSWVKDICLSARIFFADEALRFGLVSGVYEGKEKTIEAAIRWATLVAEKSPVAVQGTKELLNYSRDHSIEDGKVHIALHLFQCLQRSQDFDIQPFGTAPLSSRKTFRQP